MARRPGIASALIGAGLDWLQAQQVQQVIAPMNGGAHRAHRFLSRGFDQAPFLFEPRNPPYYPALFERCGFEPISRWFSYDLSRQEAADRVQNSPESSTSKTDSSWVVPQSSRTHGPPVVVSYRAEDSQPVATTSARELERTLPGTAR